MNAAPMIVGSQLTITRGATLRFNANDLTPKVAIPYDIRSIRMSAYPSIETAPAGIGATSALKGFLKWQFTMGRMPLTDGFVPMWNLTPVRQKISENGGYYEWRFKSPMLVPPGGRLDALVQLQSTTPNPGVTPITVAVAFAGLLRPDLDTFPRMIDVPFASCWDTTVRGQQGLGNDGQTLRNPLIRAVDVEKIICRVQADTNGQEGDDSVGIQIFDPWGRTVHRSGSIEIHALFPPNTRALDYVGQIPGSNGRFAVRLDLGPAGGFRPMVSYIGSRREPIL
jgi:hypothetical protein